MGGTPVEPLGADGVTFGRLLRGARHCLGDRQEGPQTAACVGEPAWAAQSRSMLGSCSTRRAVERAREPALHAARENGEQAVRISLEEYSRA